MDVLKTTYTQLIQVCAIRKKDAILRYTLAISLLDEDGSGQVDVRVIKSRLSELFGVSPKTVYNFLCKMENGNYGRLSNKGRQQFYYLSQYNLSALLGQEITRRKAVQVDLNTISGTPVQFRAWMEACLLAGKPRSITRQTRQEKISGTSRRTQRKYDKIQGVNTRLQYALVGEYSDELYQKHMENEGHCFLLHDKYNVVEKKGTHKFILFQRANLYNSQIETKRKPIRGSKLHSQKPVSAHTPFERVFFSDFDSAYKSWNKNQDSDAYYPSFEYEDFTVLRMLNRVA